MCHGSTLPGLVLGLAIKLGSLSRATVDHEKKTLILLLVKVVYCDILPLILVTGDV